MAVVARFVAPGSGSADLTVALCADPVRACHSRTALSSEPFGASEPSSIELETAVKSYTSFPGLRPSVDFCLPIRGQARRMQPVFQFR